MAKISMRSEAAAENGWIIPLELRQQLLVALQEDEALPLEMSYEEFLTWADENVHAEWVDGTVILMSPASSVHQELVGFLYELLVMFVRFRQLGRVYMAPFQMKLPQSSGREPDLIFIKRENLSRLKNTYLDGPADLVVEIISPESIGRDRGDKFYEYEAGRVPEYWLLDPITQRSEFYQLGEDGRYQLIQLQDSVYYAHVLPGFWLKPAWLWQDPLPSPLRTLAEIAGVDMSLVEAFEQALGDMDG
jgi:Uma2 family endonuclease